MQLADPVAWRPVFRHRLFESTGTLRFLQSTDESWDELVRRQAAALHTAINRSDSKAVEELFSLGGVHIDMLLGAVEGSTIRPLHHAAFTGSAEVLRVLMDEMPNPRSWIAAQNSTTLRTCLHVSVGISRWHKCS